MFDAVLHAFQICTVPTVARDPAAEGETVRLLVCIDSKRGVAEHIPTSSDHPLCKTRIKLSLWHIEERPVNEARICRRCAAMLAKQARSLPSHPSRAIPRGHSGMLAPVVYAGGVFIVLRRTLCDEDQAALSG